MATAKQIAWRKKFAEMSRSGTLKKKRSPAKRRAKKTAVRSNPAPSRAQQNRRAAPRSNPVRRAAEYKVQARSSATQWRTILRLPSFREAEIAAKALHAQYPTRYYRVMGPDGWDD